VSGRECVILVLQCGSLVVTKRLLFISIPFRNLSEEQELDPRELQCVPEEFWNCAEISIYPSGPSTPTTPNPTLQPVATTPNPTLQPVAAPQPDTNAPIMQPPIQAPTTTVPPATPVPVTTTSAPVPTPTAAPNAPQPPGTCGGGYPGNGLCPDPNMCCSKWGHCGTDRAWCIPPEAPAGTCGEGNLGNGRCPDSYMCCSKWGHCGHGPEWCNRRQLRSMNTTENEEIVAV
jgi:hypothetical protein